VEFVGPRECITEGRLVDPNTVGGWNHLCSWLDWSKEDDNDLWHGDGWGKYTERVGAKYVYTDVQEERWSIGVWVVLGDKAVRTENEGIGEGFIEKVQRESEYGWNAVWIYAPGKGRPVQYL